MDNEKWDTAKDNVRRLSNFIGLTDPNSHWIPIADKEYDTVHPAINARPDRAEHLKQFSIGNGSSNVVSINVARENRKLKEIKNG